MDDPDGRRAVAAFLDDREDELFAEAETLLRYDTSNPPGRTRDLIEHLRESFDGLGLDTEIVARDEQRPNLLVTIPGAQSGERPETHTDERPGTLLYVGHVDTVPFDAAEWEYDPLGEWVSGAGSDREEDRLYGRGATDMKGAVAAMVTVACAFAETGTIPPVTLEFAFVSDEETGGEAGLGHLLDRDRLDANACVVGEPTCEGGRHSVAVADRGSLWLTLEADGVAAHGSRPALGVNAIDRLYRAVGDLREVLAEYPLTLAPKLDPIVEESVAFYAPRMGEQVARETFEHPTFNLGTISGGEAINAVPTSATAEIDVRVTASVDTGELFEAVSATLADHDWVEVSDVSRADGTYEPAESSLVEALAGIAEAETGTRIYRRSATGGGDAKKLRNVGVPTVEFALGTDTVHAVDEYVTATALRQNASIYAQLPYVLREHWE